LAGWVNNLRGCGGSIDKTLLAGVSLFVVSLAFFLWLRYEQATDSSHRELPAIADETVSVSDPDPRGEPPSPSSNKKVERSNNIAPQSASGREALPDATSQARINEPAPVSDPVQGESEQAAYEEPLGNLAISGRVLTRSGSPAAGIEVTATATHLFEQGRRKAIPRGARTRQATSAYDGAYTFEDLANGEYQVATVATDRYTRALLQVRAGVDFADLIVTGHQDVRVQGLVATSSGEPLARVKVRASVADAREVMTNKDGRYGFDVKLPDNATAVLVRASRDGYQDKDVQLATNQSADTNVLELNIVMEPEADTELADVTGSVKGPDREPVTGQRIQLSSAKVRKSYQSVSDTDGTFAFGGVEPGDDYMVSINASDAYQDYFQRDIEVPEQGLTLNIELADRDTGVLRGQMVNLFGTAVADFSLVLQTTATSYENQQVIGDASGNFVVEKAPAGELRLRTKSNPYYSVEGIRLEPDAELQVTVVLDWGYDEIQGRVLNEDGHPVAVPNINLTWAHQQNGIRTTARRTAAADEHGNFRFTQLGPGNHRLNINAAGYQPVSLIHDVALQGSDLVVELAAK